jgi:hypothetical protein
MRHHYDFGRERELVGDDLVNPGAWDALRTESSGPFAIAETRSELERLADEQPDLAGRAAAIHAWLAAEGLTRVASYGVGAAVLEVCLERLEPSRRMILTEYAPATVARLGELFPAAHVEMHDLRADLPFEADVHLFHRIDTELTNAEWKRLLRRFADETLLVVPAGLAGLSELANELLLRLWRRPVSRAGWVRNRAALERLWRPTHAATPHVFHDLEGWLLRPLRAL